MAFLAGSDFRKRKKLLMEEMVEMLRTEATSAVFDALESIVTSVIGMVECGSGLKGMMVVGEDDL